MGYHELKTLNIWEPRIEKIKLETENSESRKWKLIIENWRLEHAVGNWELGIGKIIKTGNWNSKLKTENWSRV